MTREVPENQIGRTGRTFFVEEALFIAALALGLLVGGFLDASFPRGHSVSVPIDAGFDGAVPVPTGVPR